MENCLLNQQSDYLEHFLDTDTEGTRMKKSDRSYPAKKSIQALLQKVRHFIKTEGRQLSATSLIQKLNPIIRDWAIYHRHIGQRNFTE